jgi:hypothetical protein
MMPKSSSSESTSTAALRRRHPKLGCRVPDLSFRSLIAFTAGITGRSAKERRSQ